MRSELKSTEAREALIKLLSGLGMIYPENGRYTASAYGIEYFAVRMAASVVRLETDSTTTQRFCNALEDLCSLGTITATEAPQKADRDHSAVIEEVKCVHVTGTLVRARWCVLSPPASESGSVGVDEQRYFPWEEDFLCALRLFAYFRRFTPENWTWPANHITLKWKSPPLRDDYLLTALAEHADRLDVDDGKTEGLATFRAALSAVVDARNAVLARLPSPWMQEKKPTGLKALLQRLRPAPEETVADLLQRCDKRMQELCSVIGYV